MLPILHTWIWGHSPTHPPVVQLDCRLRRLLRRLVVCTSATVQLCLGQGCSRPALAVASPPLRHETLQKVREEVAETMRQPHPTLPTRKVLLLQCYFVSSSPSAMYEQCAKDNLLKWKPILGWSHFMAEEPEAQKGRITRPPSSSRRARETPSGAISSPRSRCSLLLAKRAQGRVCSVCSDGQCPAAAKGTCSALSPF